MAAGPFSRKIPSMRLVAFVLLVLTIALAYFSDIHGYVTFERLKEYRGLLEQAVTKNYALSVLIYILAYVLAATAIPGALLVTLAGGLLFHTFPGAFYATAAATLGGVLAFALSRYLVGSWLQVRYSAQLRRFNREMQTNGHFYLIAMRLVPVFPFCLVSYLAGLTALPLRTFTCSTAAGVFPACLVYTFLGSQIGNISSSSDIASPRLLLALLCLAILCLLPVAWRKWTRRKEKGQVPL